MSGSSTRGVPRFQPMSFNHAPLQAAPPAESTASLRTLFFCVLAISFSISCSTWLGEQRLWHAGQQGSHPTAQQGTHSSARQPSHNLINR